jgi:SAM-dependent methyltransferase
MNDKALGEFYSEEQDETLERVACPLCGSSDCAVYRVSHDRLFGRPGNYYVEKCRACGMTFTNPRPTFASLGRHYPPDYFCYEPLESLRGFKRWVMTGVIRGLVRRRLQALESVIGRVAAGTRVCDVGCGLAQLLSALRDERGCDVVGVDFSADMAEYGRKKGIPIVHGTLKQAAFEEGRFDVLTMTEYLEHEAHPSEVLRECRRVTKPGGHLLIEVPAIGTFGARLFGNYWSQLDVPRHLMFFTEDTLGRMLKESGFEPLRAWYAPGSIAMSLLHVLGYEGIGSMTTRDILATALATIPLLPALPFLREFMYVVARAAPAAGLIGEGSGRAARPADR